MRRALRLGITWGWALLLVGLGWGPSAALALPLWQLTGPKNSLFLLGSVHALRASDYPLAPAITAAFKQADVVVMEIDMQSLDPVTSAQILNTLARDSRGRQLPELLGPEAWQATVSAAKRLQLDLAPLIPFEPWYGALLVTQLRLAKLGLDPALGIEAHLTEASRQRGIQIIGLETLASQLGSLDSLPPTAQQTFLKSTLEEEVDKPDNWLGAWRVGNTERLNKALLDGIRAQPEVYESLVLRRNKNFARAIAGLANGSQNYLIVVGALHLVGDDNVLKMLLTYGIGSRQIRGP